MNNAAKPVIGIATFLFGVLAAVLVYVACEPQAEGLARRLDDLELELRSDDVAFAEIPRLRRERDELAARYAPLFAQDAQAVFVRELATALRRHGLTLLATSLASNATSADPTAGQVPLRQIHLSLQIRGDYRALLAVTSELSQSAELVGVSAPSLRRDRGALVGTVPVTIYEPLQASTEDQQPHVTPGNAP
jgi:Tfp pilus assembly protein PilO